MDHSIAYLAPSSRIWIFQSDRFLSNKEHELIKKIMDEFIPQWASHGNDLYGGYEIKEKLFLAIGVDESRSPASGCSIDTLTRTIKEIGVQLNIDFFNRMAISYVNTNEEIEIISMNEFKRLIVENKVNENTIVYNNLVNTKQDFDTNWRTTAKNSWHTNLFELA